MDADFLYLRASVTEAVTLLTQDTPLEARAHHARAVLQAALIHLQCHAVEEPSAAMTDRSALYTDAPFDDDIESVERAPLAARSLSEYREERGMHIPAFTTFLGITHREYTHVIHREPVDRRVRDQIAYKLGVAWREIAEFMPAQPRTWPEIVPVPAPEGTPPPPEPWYLVDEKTGRIVSGPHDTPTPENGAYLRDQLTHESTNLVILFSPWTTEEEYLPPSWGIYQISVALMTKRMCWRITI